MADLSTYADTPESPAKSLKAVTPHATNNLPDGVCKAIWIGGAGDIDIVAQDDTAAITIAGVPAGTLIPIRAKAVRATSTATGIVALY